MNVLEKIGTKLVNAGRNSRRASFERNAKQIERTRRDIVGQALKKIRWDLAFMFEGEDPENGLAILVKNSIYEHATRKGFDEADIDAFTFEIIAAHKAQTQKV